MRRLLAGCLGLAAAAATWTVLAPATPLAPPAPRCLFVFSETNDPRVKVVQRPCHGTVLAPQVLLFTPGPLSRFASTR